MPRSNLSWSEEEPARFALSRLCLGRPDVARRLVEVHGSAQAALADFPASDRSIPAAVLKRWEEAGSRGFRRLVEADVAWAGQPGQGALFWPDSGFPKNLRALQDPPWCLYYQGNQPCLDAIQMAVVGSRRPTPTGLDIAAKLSSGLTELDFVITSGLAYGIDAAAHRACLAAGGRAVVVQARGLDGVYPRRHEQLLGRLLEQGVQVSEYPLGTPPNNWQFPQRNRLVTGLAVGTLVVEAALKSGSMISARLAMEQGREVFAVPGSPVNPQSEGCHWLIRQGAKLTTCIEDMLEEFPGVNVKPSVAANELSAEDQALLTRLSEVPVEVDALCEQGEESLQDLLVRLTRLEIDGRVRSSPFGYVKCLTS